MNLDDAIITLERILKIEEELGIDLFVFLEALTQDSLFVKCGDEIIETDIEFGFNKDSQWYYLNLDVCHLGHLYLKDYGKTWVLTKEELE